VQRNVNRAVAEPEENTMYYDDDFDEEASRRRRGVAGTEVNTMYYADDFDESDADAA
jgi:hypothetical protein